MIKRLRTKFICVMMVFFSLMLLAIFGLVHHFTIVSMREQSLAALQGFAEEFNQPDKDGPDDDKPDDGKPDDDKPDDGKPDDGKPDDGKPDDGKPDDGPPGEKPGDKPLKDGLLGEKPFDRGPRGKEPVFTLSVSQDGLLEAAGSDFYDLGNEEYLTQVYEAAAAWDRETGVLWRYGLRYLRIDGRYYFVDITTQLHTSRDLVFACLIIGAAALMGFFFIALWLSRWMVRPVEEAWDRQRQFVADASHELKTPLTVILTNAELLRSPDYDIPAKDRFADSILSMSRQMRGLVESLLDLARVDGSNMRAQMEPLDFSQLTEDAVLPFEPLYFEAGRELCSQVEPGIRVNGSNNYLRQVVEILLDNGCKYGAAGQSVSLTLQRQGRGHCLLRVVSQGETLSPQQCRDIFKRFYRVDEARAMRRSYGLGLPIAMGIVTEHRGRIWAESKNGVNTFCVSLPTI